MAPSAVSLSAADPTSIIYVPGTAGLKDEAENVQMPTLASLGGPKFATVYEEREYQKIRLALAFRIFAKLGFDEGVAGHITLRVSRMSSWTFEIAT